MKETTYTLHEYDHEFDAGLAKMWNESDDQWPGTFTDGVPMTEKNVCEWMDKLDAIIRFVIVEDETAQVVGYGDLWDTSVRPKSCYVALLNVHPEHQGKSLARRMLVRMVDWSVENGYDRITIGTWPSNLKAMPLYKKVGFFWQPDTTVHMENYLPAVRLLPAAQDFFARHDWYRDYDRKLDQVEDDMTHPCTGDTKVYILRWQSEGDLLETIFDRNAQALTGIETQDWAAYARTAESEPAQGMAYGFEWEIANKSDRPQMFGLEAKPDEGICLDFKDNVTLKPGERRIFKTSFKVDLDAPKYRTDHEDLPTPRVRTMLEVDGEAIELGTGLRYGPAAEFSMHPAVATFVPGVAKTIHLQLKNRTKSVLSGNLNIELPDGLTADAFESRFTAAPEGFAGVPITLTAMEEGFYPLMAHAAIENDGEIFSTKSKQLSIAAVAHGGWTAGEDEEALIVENDYFRITVNAKGGEAVIWNKDTDREEVRLMEEFGPPFIPWDLNELKYGLKLEKSEKEVRAIATVRSGRFPGLVVGREMTVTASPLIKVRGWVENTTGQAFEKTQLRPHLRIWSENRKEVTVPLRDRMVHEHGSQFGTADEDFPKKTDDYSEAWFSYSLEGRTTGIIWPKEGVEEIDSGWGRIFFYMNMPLGPKETESADPYYVYAGPGDWRAVRQVWRRVSGERVLDSAAEKSHLEAAFSPAPMLTLDDAFDQHLHVSTTRKYRLTGSVRIESPEGWQVEPDQSALALDDEHPLDMPVRVTTAGPTPVGHYAGDIHIHSQALDRIVPFDLIRLGDRAGQVGIKTVEDLGFETWVIDNGSNQWTVVPGFQAGVTRWTSADSDQNHLLSMFPESGELSWLKPVFGGIRPIINEVAGGDSWPGKLHNEIFAAQEISLVDRAGFDWRGVRLTTGVQAEKFRGLLVQLDYLTLPGSNVLKCVFRLVNPTTVYRPAQSGWLAFLQVDGSKEKAVLHTSEYVRKRTPLNSWGFTDVWAAVENPDTGRAVVGVHANGHRRLQAADMGAAGVHLNIRQSVDVPPGGEVVRVAYFALAENVRQARGYAALADLIE